MLKLQGAGPAEEESEARDNSLEHECLLVLVLSMFVDWCSQTLPSVLRKVKA